MRKIGQGVQKELPVGLIAWYGFKRGSRVLCIRGGIEECDTIGEYLKERGMHVSELEIDEMFSSETNHAYTYDYIILVGVVERCTRRDELLIILRGLLSQTGKLLMGTDNRLGIRYFCGDRDVFTGRNYDGIENYTRAGVVQEADLPGHAFAKFELTEILERSGFSCHKFYSVIPSITNPQIILADGYQPQEELETRIFPEYNYPDSIFLEEQRLYTSLLQNGLFHAMANGFFIECSIDGNASDVKQVTVSVDRGRSNACCTIIRNDNQVEKRAVYAEGKGRLQMLRKNMEDLKSHGVPVADIEFQEDCLVMPFIEGENTTAYFRRIFTMDKDRFVEELDVFWKLILNSSEHVPYQEIDWECFEPGWKKRRADDPNKEKWKKIAFGSEEDKLNLGVILKRGYIDMVSINCFHVKNKFVFFDQEFYVENLPAATLLLRTIDFIYQGNAQLEKIIPKKHLLERYHLNRYQELFRKFTYVFFQNILNKQELSLYHKARRADMEVLNSNRQRINYSEHEYQRMFKDIFKGLNGNKKLYLFGTGTFAKIFVSRFGKDYEISGVFDNNSGRWGCSFDGIPILSPRVLQELEKGTYKIIICIKNYGAVVRQLQRLGIKEYGVFDKNIEYPRKNQLVIKQEKCTRSKKYHIGYVAGVFDLFHVGHLNLLRRAKEQCDYLIVGVVNDESVIKNKKTKSFIPFDERIEIVGACKYVDEAVEIPTDYADTEEAYQRYHFDVQFSGNDYENDPDWIAKKAYLQQHGAEMVFFPYTERVSSTKIKRQLGERA